METIKMQSFEMEVTESVIIRLYELGYSVESLKDAMGRHESRMKDGPSVYVGTYSKYKCGLLRGLWIDLTTFDDYDEFINFCKAIHADEEDPELMALSYICFPRIWNYEGFMSEDNFYNIQIYSELCKDYDVNAVNDFMEIFNTLNEFEDKYVGRFDSEEDFAYHIIEEAYDLDEKMGEYACYFDYAKFARDLFIDKFLFSQNGFVFRRR